MKDALNSIAKYPAIYRKYYDIKEMKKNE